MEITTTLKRGIPILEPHGKIAGSWDLGVAGKAGIVDR